MSGSVRLGFGRCSVIPVWMLASEPNLEDPTTRCAGSGGVLRNRLRGPNQRRETGVSPNSEPNAPIHERVSGGSDFGPALGDPRHRHPIAVSLTYPPGHTSTMLMLSPTHLSFCRVQRGVVPTRPTDRNGSIRRCPHLHLCSWLLRHVLATLAAQITGREAGAGFVPTCCVACQFSSVRKHHSFFGTALLHVAIQVSWYGCLLVAPLESAIPAQTSKITRLSGPKSESATRARGPLRRADGRALRRRTAATKLGGAEIR